MTNLEKYDDAFVYTLDVSKDELNADLVYQRHKSWDSLSHMELMVKMEEAFDIAISTVDVTDFSSYERGKKILEGYGVLF